MQLVLFIRHGTAEFKAGHLYGWTPGVHLSAKGREEVKHLAERLEMVKLNAVYSSPLERCVETAEAVLDGRRLEMNVVEELGEVRYGRWQGKAYKNLVKTPLWRVIQTVPSQARFPGPGGESLLELQRRGVAAVEEIRTRHRRGIIAVVSHADMIKAVVTHYLGLHLDLFQRIVVDTASVSAFAFYGGIPRLIKLNEIGTLEGLKLPPAHQKKTKKT